MTTTYEDVRRALTEVFDAPFTTAFPDVPIEYENTNLVDREKQVEIGPFVEFLIQPHDSEKVNCGFPSLVRYTAMLLVTVHVPDGKGVKDANLISAWVSQKFSSQMIDTIQCMTLQRLRPQPTPGFSSTPLAIPFWYDSIE
jgi:hypothetical protein